MAENETIGRATCPVCGAISQDVKTSKNNLMYIYCENNCRVWFAGRHRKFIAGLKAGISQQVDKIFIKSIKSKELNENEQPNRRIEQPNNATSTGYSGNSSGRRTSGESVAVRAGSEQRSSWLAGILSDDDDE